MHLAAQLVTFGMPVLNLSAGLCNVRHTLGTEFIELGIRSRLVVTTLVGSREHAAVFRNDVILQFAHGLEPVSYTHLRA